MRAETLLTITTAACAGTPNQMSGRARRGISGKNRNASRAMDS